LVFSCAYERIADEGLFVAPHDTPALTLVVTVVK
jgi:hypothetical protein